MMAQCSTHAQFSRVYIVSRVTGDRVPGPLKTKIKKEDPGDEATPTDHAPLQEGTAPLGPT